MCKHTRQSNIELLRIMLMLLIIAGHIVMYSGYSSNVGDTNYYIANFIRSFTTMAVDCFVLISGYFGLHASIRGYLRTSCQTWFYSVSIFILCVLLGIHTIDLKHDIQFLAPVVTKQWWYVTIYLVLYIISPWINKLVDSITKQSLKILLMFLFIIFCLIPSFCYLINAQTITNDAGYGICNFVFLYLLGRYLNLYYNKVCSKYIYLLLWMFCGILLFASNTLLTKLFGFYFNSFISYDTIFCFCGSVFLFLFFLNINFKNNFINKISKNTLAVYLIHLHPALSEFLFVDLLKVDSYSDWKFVVIIFIYTFVIFIICTIIEILRKFIFYKFEIRLSKLFMKCISNIKEKIL